MELIDRRKMKEPEEKFDDFRPTLEGFITVYDSVLLRELKLPDESSIVTPDAFAEPCLYCEVVYTPACYLAGDQAIVGIPLCNGDIVRILKGIGTTIQFSDSEPGQRYFTVHAQDVIGKWKRK